METNFDKSIENAISRLEENDKKLSELRNQLEKVIEEQEKKFYETVEKLYPLMEFFKRKNYRFRNPKYNYFSSRGPIVGMSKNGQFLYVFDVESKWIKGIDLYKSDDEGKYISFRNFIMEHSFEDAMEGLLKTIDLQNDAIDDYQNSIYKLEGELSKFS